MRALPILLSISLTVSGPAEARPADQQVVKELEQFTTDLNRAMAQRDGAALHRLLADEFHFVHAFGYADDKATFIAEALEGPIPPAPPFRVTPEMRLHTGGDLVVVTNPSGGTSSGTRAWATSVYVRRDGRWQLALRQGTEMNAPAKPVPISTEQARAYVGTWSSDAGTIRIEQRPQGLFTVSTRFPARLMLPIGPDLFTTKVGGTIRFEREAGTPVRVTFENRGKSRVYTRAKPAR